MRLHVQSHVIFSQFTVKTPQSWSNLGRGEIQPSGLVSVLLSSGKAHLPTSTSENPSLAELGRNYRGTIKTSIDPSKMDPAYTPTWEVVMHTGSMAEHCVCHKCNSDDSDEICTPKLELNVCTRTGIQQPSISKCCAIR